MEEVQGRVELKYCERCGSLWLRPIGSRNTYCCGCEHQMRELPFAGYHKAGKRRKKAEFPETGILHASCAPLSETAQAGGAL